MRCHCCPNCWNCRLSCNKSSTDRNKSKRLHSFYPISTNIFNLPCYAEKLQPYSSYLLFMNLKLELKLSCKTLFPSTSFFKNMCFVYVSAYKFQLATVKGCLNTCCCHCQPFCKAYASCCVWCTWLIQAKCFKVKPNSANVCKKI